MNYHERISMRVAKINPLPKASDDVLTSVDVCGDDGVIRNIVQSQKVVYSTLNDGFKPSDFSLNNLISVGAVSNLKQVQYQSNDYEALASQLDSLMADYDSHIKSVNVSPEENI